MYADLFTLKQTIIAYLYTLSIMLFVHFLTQIKVISHYIKDDSYSFYRRRIKKRINILLGNNLYFVESTLETVKISKITKVQNI